MKVCRTCSGAEGTGQSAKSRSMYQTFFHSEWEARRDEEDLPFLHFLVGKAIVEHPDCLDLLLFQLVVLRFIFRDTKQANDQQKKIQNNKGIKVDRAFHLYAVIRRATQDSVSSSLGQGGSHQNCLSLMKKFWHRVLKEEKSGSTAYGRASPAVIEDMVLCVNDYEEAVENAKSEYRWLMEKFPHSTSVILSYAHFTDTVINDIKAATKLHTLARRPPPVLFSVYSAVPVSFLAAVLENEGDIEEAEDQVAGEGLSSVSSENDARSNILKFMHSWRLDIVGMEFATLRALQTRVMVCVFFILTISVVGFVMMDLVLFSEEATENLRLIDVSGLFRALSVNSAFWLRSLMMAAHAGNFGDFASAMQMLMKDHAANFKLINSGD
ncbi:hypothetical protein T484DRAFT_1803841, partial [Baffinella frigidus]